MTTYTLTQEQVDDAVESSVNGDGFTTHRILSGLTPLAAPSNSQRLGDYVAETATSHGWKHGDPEDALTFMMRKCREVAIDDCKALKATPSTSPEVDMPTEAEVAMDAFSRITEQTVRADQLQTLAIDYAALCGVISKGLSPLDKEWIDLRDLGERLDALAEHNFKGGA